MCWPAATIPDCVKLERVLLCIYSMLVVAVACYIMQLVLFQKDPNSGLYGFPIMVFLSTVSKQRLIFAGIN